MAKKAKPTVPSVSGAKTPLKSTARAKATAPATAPTATASTTATTMPTWPALDPRFMPDEDDALSVQTPTDIPYKEPLLANLQFRYPMRRYQEEILSLVNTKLANGEREIHIVAPPGAGKTIIGIQLISTIKCPAIILCPNTTIQSQWGGKLDLFLPLVDDGVRIEDLLGTHEDVPLKPITVLTYQVLSTPGHEQDYLEKLAHKGWVEELMRGREITMGEAELRVLEILQNNPKAHAKEISRHVSRLRKKLTEVMDLNEVLHPNAMKLLQALRRQKFKMVLFDECHHLTDYWAAIMIQLVKFLDDPIVVGLTGTPPEKKSQSQEMRYLSLVGDIDYQVPTPALVRERGLAPFQDLAYFVEPTGKEFDFLTEQHAEFHKLIEELCVPPPSTALIAGNAMLPQLPQSNPAPAPAPANGSQPAPVVIANLPPLSQFVFDKALEIEANGGGFAALMKSDLAYASALLRALWQLKLPRPKDLEFSPELTQAPLLEDWMVLLEDFASQKLKLSSKTKDHALFERIKSATRKLGYAITEQGLRKQASPVDRVLAFSEAKPRAVADILALEYRVLQDRLRAVVVTDFEKTSATAVKSTGGILNEESGGAIAAMRILLKAPVSTFINPVLVTGSLLLVDKRIADQFIEAAKQYIKDAGFKFALTIKEHSPNGTVREITPEAGPEIAPEVASEQNHALPAPYQDVIDNLASFDTFNQEENSENLHPVESPGQIKILFDKELPEEDITSAANSFASVLAKREALVGTGDFVELSAGSSAWESRLYVAMATAIFERGITKCLIGTRGLFGEGWDSQALNTLIDLTTTTSPVSVKQLRGRSIRIQTNDAVGARKVANNWDVVCIAPALEKGLNDYQRFVRKHDGFFGICDDGQIECGVGHVHPAFSELTPAEVFASTAEFNREMMDRALVRDQIYDLWKVGQPYNNRLVECVEVSRLRKLTLTPPHLRHNMDYQAHVAELRSQLNGVWFEYMGLASVLSAVTLFFTASLAPLAFASLAPLILGGALARVKHRKLYQRIEADILTPGSQEQGLRDMATAMLVALQQTRFVPPTVSKESIRATVRSDGSYRVFLDNVEAQVSKHFSQSMRELLAPISNQPYLVGKYEYPLLDKLGPKIEVENNKQRFVRKYLSGRSEPYVASYHGVPGLLARSEKGRVAFQDAWNKYVSPGFVIQTETKPELLNKYFGIGPSLAQRLLWE
ncbi:MAG: DEAD/DEAH box helicase family protein [Cyanobacteria bacterium REEB67]|nr:DEAD/DEAH box helicase family protein [Cyanobacteria bacterium REEB67]